MQFPPSHPPHVPVQRLHSAVAPRGAFSHSPLARSTMLSNLPATPNSSGGAANNSVIGSGLLPTNGGPTPLTIRSSRGVKRSVEGRILSNPSVTPSNSVSCCSSSPAAVTPAVLNNSSGAQTVTPDAVISPATVVAVHVAATNSNSPALAALMGN